MPTAGREGGGGGEHIYEKSFKKTLTKRVDFYFNGQVHFWEIVHSLGINFGDR